MTLSDYLKQYREAQKISQRKLAERCGVSNGYIAMLEKGSNPKTQVQIIPSLPTLNKMCEGMGVTLDALLDAVDDLPLPRPAPESGKPFPGEAPPSEQMLTFDMDPLELLSSDERALIRSYRAADPVYQQVALDILKAHRK